MLRGRSVDPLVPAVGVVGALVYALHGFHSTLTRDLGIYSYAGQQVAHGVPPYLGVLNRAGPLAHVLPGVGAFVARAAGLDDVVTMRGLFLLFAVATVCAMYVAGRDLLHSRAAGLVAAATLLSFYGFIQYASNGPREKTPMTLFIVGAVWAVSRQRWFAAGVCTALATLCLQTALFSTGAVVLVGLLLSARGHRLRSLLQVVVGGSVPVAMLGVWFALAGSLQASIEGFYLINRRYTTPNPITDDLPAVWADLRTAYGVTVWPLLAGLAVAVGIAGCALSRRARTATPLLTDVAPAGAGVVVGLLWTLRDYDAWPDLFPVLPLSAIGVGALYALLARRLTARAGTALAAALLATAVTLALTFSISTRDHTLDVQRRDTAAVLAQLPRTATITSIEAPQPLVLTRRTNPTRYQMFRGGLQDYMQDTWPGGLAGFQRDLVARRPDLIAVGTTVSRTWRRSLGPQYVYVGSAPGWGWYARVSLGTTTIAALRAATHAGG